MTDRIVTEAKLTMVLDRASHYPIPIFFEDVPAIIAALREARSVIRDMIAFKIPDDSIDSVRLFASEKPGACPDLPTQVWGRHQKLCRRILHALGETTE